MKRLTTVVFPMTLSGCLLSQDSLTDKLAEVTPTDTNQQVNSDIVIQSVWIEPENPKTNDIVQVSLVLTDSEGNSVDPGSLDEAPYFEWYNVPYEQTEPLTVQVGEDKYLDGEEHFDKGDRIFVVAGIGDLEGSSDEVVIVNTPPTRPEIEITPNPAQTGDDLRCEMTGQSVDEDGDFIYYLFYWFNPEEEEVLVTDEPLTLSLDLDGTTTYPGIWRCSVIASDLEEPDMESVAVEFVEVESTQSDECFSLGFDGEEGHLEVPHDPDFVPGTSDFTVEGWIHLNPSQFGHLWSQGADGAYPFYTLQYHSNNVNQGWHLNFTISDSSSDYVILNTDQTFEFERWYHVVTEREGNELHVFVNGERQDTTIAASTGTMLPGEYDIDNQGGFHLSRSSLNPDVGYGVVSGVFSNVRVSNDSIYDGEDFIPETSLDSTNETVILLKLNEWENDSGVVTDYSGNGNNGFFEGGTYVDFCPIHEEDEEPFDGECAEVVSAVQAPIRYLGENNVDSARSITSAGDVNGDGVDDILIGASGFDGNLLNVGKAYLFLSPNLPVGEIDLTTANYQFIGGQNGMELGYDVRSAGDVDGDSLADVLLCGRDDTQTPERAFLITSATLLNEPEGSYNVMDLHDVAFKDTTANASGVCDSAGDLDGDGLDDIIIGAQGYDNFSGAVYVIKGSTIANWPATDFNLLNHSNHVITNLQPSSRFGNSVAAAGDVNGDGRDDVLIGALNNTGTNGNQSGVVYLYSGTTLVSNQQYFDTDDHLFRFLPEAANDNLGSFVASAGDVDDDGDDDILLGAFGNDDGGNNAGKVYLFLGGNLPSSQGDHSVVNADYVFIGEEADDRVGNRMAAGDFDGDGKSDVVISARGNDFAHDNAGKVYVFTGEELTTPGVQNMEDATIVYLGSDEDYHYGTTLGVGDIDGDTLDDLLIGAQGFNDAGAGGIFLSEECVPLDADEDGVDSWEDCDDYNPQVADLRPVLSCFGDAMVTLGTSSDFNFGDTDSFTIDYWAYYTVDSQLTLSKGTSVTKEYAITGTQSDVAFVRQDSNTDMFVTTPKLLEEWAHYTVVFDAGDVQWYVNGVPQQTGVGSLGNSSNSQLRLCNRPNGSEPMNGMLANLSIFDIALNDNAVERIHDGDDDAESVTGVVGHWDMDEGVGADIIDSVDGQNGSISDASWDYACIP